MRFHVDFDFWPSIACELLWLLHHLPLDENWVGCNFSPDTINRKYHTIVQIVVDISILGLEMYLKERNLCVLSRKNPKHLLLLYNFGLSWKILDCEWRNYSRGDQPISTPFTAFVWRYPALSFWMKEDVCHGINFLQMLFASFAAT